MDCPACEGGVLEWRSSGTHADVYRCRSCNKKCEIPTMPDDEVLEQMAKERGPVNPVKDDYGWV